MKILITGAKGQLGSEIQRVLKTGKSEIGAIDPVFKNAKVAAVDIEHDISNMQQVTQLVDSVKPDVIINCAAMTNVDACETDFSTAMKVNAIGPRNLAVAAERCGAKLIHISTDYVFSGDGYRPYVEWDVCNPQSIYGKSKRLGEEYALNFCSRCFVVRTAWLYGYEGKNFVKTIIKAAREKGSLMVVNDQRGNPTNANDFAHHILKLALTDEYGIYHCTGNGECTWFDFAKKIVESSNIPCEVNPCTTEEFPRPAKRPAYSSLENLMLKCTVGDEMRDWQTALEMYIKNLEEEQ